MKGLTDILQYLFKVFSMFKMSICYDKNTVDKNVPDDLETKCINCGKTIGCTLGNQSLEAFITVFPHFFCFSMLVYLGSLAKKSQLLF